MHDPTSAENPFIGADRSDEILFQEIRRNRTAALDELLQRHWPSLLAYAHRLLGSGDDAEDVVQSAFVQLWERRANWRDDGSVRGYLYRVTRNLALNEQRRRRIRERIWQQPAIEPGLEAGAPAQALDASELERVVAEALAAMPPRRREVFELVRFEGLSYREVAQAMGVSVQTVANQMSAALAHLRVALQAFM
jgi:RNA polymerase sigma-70 factor, ECF subfamily